MCRGENVLCEICKKAMDYDKNVCCINIDGSLSTIHKACYEEWLRSQEEFYANLYKR